MITVGYNQKEKDEEQSTKTDVAHLEVGETRSTCNCCMKGEGGKQIEGKKDLRRKILAGKYKCGSWSVVAGDLW